MTGGRGPRTSTVLLESVVVACFHHTVALNRAEIAEHTGLSRTVVTSLVKTLLARGTLSVVPGSRAPGPGRPAVSYQLSTAVAPVALVRLGLAGTAVTLASGTGALSTARIRTMAEPSGASRSP